MVLVLVKVNKINKIELNTYLNITTVTQYNLKNFEIISKLQNTNYLYFLVFNCIEWLMIKKNN